MNILVTGAGGLIGRHAVEALTRSGHRVSGIYRNPPNRRSDIAAVVVDLLSRNAFDLLASMRVEAMVHAAAVLPRSFNDQSARDAARENGMIDELALRLCKKFRCPLVYISGTSVYEKSDAPWNEQSPADPEGPYLTRKLASEAMFLESGSRCLILRVSSPYGPGQKSSSVLRLFLEKALSNQDLVYYGDGRREQDFVHASDVANAVLKAIESFSASGIVNIASGLPVSMRELAQLVIRNVAGTNSKVTASGQPDPQEHYRPRIDISKARSMLDWRPEIGLDDGIRRWGLTLRAERCASA